MVSTARLISSGRLTLTPLTGDHRNAVARIFAEPETSRFLGADFTDPHRLDEMMTRRLSYRGAAGTGHWLITEHSGRAVGLAHLRDSWELPGKVPEIGRYLDARHSGQGFATEAAAALLHYAFSDLEVDDVWALVHVDNNASHAVARRLNMAQIGTGAHYGNVPHIVYCASSSSYARP